ncbi:MAG: cation:proton antiporter [Pseudomonadota bacterium]
MGHEGQEIWLKDAIVFLLAAGLVAPLFKAARLGAVLGFLVAGVLLGPYGLGRFAEAFPLLNWVTISDPHAAEPFAELGVLFLLFLLGLELSFERLWALRRAVFGAGGLQAGLSALAIGGACLAIGLMAPAAVVLGLALALSSTAIVMQILAEERRHATPTGRAALGVLLMQDILVAPILILVGFMARDGAAPLGPLLAEAAIQGVIAIVAILLIGRFLLRPIFGFATRFGGRDFLMALTLVTVVGAALMTAGAGLSLALGAFLAGLLLGETEFKHQVEVDLEPFKGLLLGVFFMTVGMALDLVQVLSAWPYVLGGLAAMLIVKGLIAYIAVRAFAGTRAVAVETAFLLAPAGEFAFIILAAAAAGAGAIISAQVNVIVGAIVGLSMLLTPAFARLGRRIAASMEAKAAPSEALEDFSDVTGHVVIAGFGRVGRSIARLLDSEEASIVGLENDAKNCSLARKAGWPVYVGDAARTEILERAGAHGAALFAVTVDNSASASQIVRAIREVRPDALILARAHDSEHASELLDAGASHVVPDAVEAGLQIAGRALVAFGVPSDTVRDRLAQERDIEYARAGLER